MKITRAALVRHEDLFARAFASQDLAPARPLYAPDVVYVSPTVRLYGWPASQGLGIHSRQDAKPPREEGKRLAGLGPAGPGSFFALGVLARASFRKTQSL
jgi:hypothetical protein